MDTIPMFAGGGDWAVGMGDVWLFMILPEARIPMRSVKMKMKVRGSEERRPPHGPSGLGLSPSGGSETKRMEDGPPCVRVVVEALLRI